ncbi:MAG: hypothetical protein GXO39_02455 [Thermotogae bacterium]|nr:hypothetical protein [Thermotogota bacterium]
MGTKDAEKILRIMAEADGSCEMCARELFIRFINEYPQHEELGKKLFFEIFGAELCQNDDKEHRRHVAQGTFPMYDFSG